MQYKWKTIRGFETYQVNELGEVRSVNRRVRWSHHKQEGYALKKGKLLKQIPRKMSANLIYMQVGLYSNTTKTTKAIHVHRLVATAFLPNPKNLPQVNHKDGNGENNKVGNLEWVTASDNSLHARRVLGRETWQKGNVGKNTPTARPVRMQSLDGSYTKEYLCISDAVREHKLDSGSITRVCQGKAKQHKGYKFTYAGEKGHYRHQQQKNQ